MLIEVIGLPGSGKTTLIKEILKRNHFSTWQSSVCHLIKTDISKIILDKKKRFIYNVILRFPIIKRKFAEYIFDILFTKHPYYQGKMIQLTPKLIQGVMENHLIDNNLKYHYIRWEIYKTVKSILLREYYDVDHVLLDEGILTSIVDIVDYDLQEVVHLLPDLVIYIKETPENTVTQMKKRYISEGKMNPSKLGKSNENLLLQQLKKYSNYNLLIDKLRYSAVKVITFDRKIQGIEDLMIELNSFTRLG